MHGAWSTIISPVIGWSYFVAWSLSFYPQVILNWRRKSINGLSLDFVYLNLFGFLSYSIYNIGLYVNQKEWGNEESVHVNDVVFALHALILTFVTVVQSVIYRRTRSKPVSIATKAFIVAAGLIVLVASLLALNESIEQRYVLYLLSYIKMAVTLVKYVPQAYFNFKRQSTTGWSIMNILLDFTGGILSILQMLADGSVTGDWSPITANPVKFGLGLASIAFDVLFMIQHYVLYPARAARKTSLPQKEDEETGPLLARTVTDYHTYDAIDAPASGVEDAER
ncbi:hypothetical protein PhCBS80983_g04869 [Powellomyces hirtus]|uniref:Cystinosin n=1 Tax=Powellomyces hirtus TaxID=109895 RepID=A0A507DXT9_9FUNG|nr:hypothetical protein PhCBS80983_g04869 [Powellomyces hirtus]